MFEGVTLVDLITFLESTNKGKQENLRDVMFEGVTSVDFITFVESTKQREAGELERRHV